MMPFAIPEMTAVAPAGCALQVGDKVKYTNEFGVPFGPFTIQGFTLPGDESHGRTVYIDSSCYWFAKPPESLTLWTDAMAEEVRRGIICDEARRVS